MRTILFVIGILSLINIILLPLVANPTIGFTVQAIISVCLILYAAFFRRIPKKIHALAGVLCLIPVMFALFLGIYGNVSNVDYEEDAVIVLGAGVHVETVSRPLAHRLDAAVEYWNQNTGSYIVVCGGLGNRAVITEAEAMARYLAARGVPRESILLEERSTSTHENLSFAKEILDGYFPDGFRAVVITNDFHIYRAMRTAQQIGITAGYVGAYMDWYTWPVNYLREMLAVMYMWFL